MKPGDVIGVEYRSLANQGTRRTANRKRHPDGWRRDRRDKLRVVMLGGKSSEHDHLPEWRVHEFGSVLSKDVASRARAGQPIGAGQARWPPAAPGRLSA